MLNNLNISYAKCQDFYFHKHLKLKKLFLTILPGWKLVPQ